MPVVHPSIGAEIRNDYADAGLTWREFAERAGIRPKTLTNITAGGPCSRRTAAKIAHELNAALAAAGLGGGHWTPERVLGQRTDQSRPADNRPPKDRPRPPNSPAPTRTPKKQTGTAA